MKLTSKLTLVGTTLLAALLLISLIGKPKPSFEKTANSNPNILPSETEIIDYNPVEEWLIKLEPKLAKAEELFIDVIDSDSLKSFSKIKGLRAPVKVSRKKNELYIKLKESPSNYDSVIIGVAKLRTKKRINWKKSYLLYLRPDVVITKTDDLKLSSMRASTPSPSASPSVRPTTSPSVWPTTSPSVRPTTSPIPSPSVIVDANCEARLSLANGETEQRISESTSPRSLSAPSTLTETVQGIFKVSYPKNDRLISATIKATATAEKPINASGSTTMTFVQEKNPGEVKFIVEDHNWYAVSKKPPLKDLCGTDYLQSEYDIEVSVKTIKPNGKICNKNYKTTTFVKHEETLERKAFMKPKLYRNINTRFIKKVENNSQEDGSSDTKQCCVKIEDQPIRMLYKYGDIVNEFIGQDQQQAQDEEARHLDQWRAWYRNKNGLIAPLTWEDGALRERERNEPSNERIYSHLEKRIYCEESCTDATSSAHQALTSAIYQAMYDVRRFMAVNRCWMEKTAKEYAKLKPPAHLECSHRHCSSDLKKPGFLSKPEVKEVIS